MEIFILVVCILITLNCIFNLASGFSEKLIEKEARIGQFVIGGGLAIWGFLLYF